MRIVQVFQQYSTTLGQIGGGAVFGKLQVKQVRDASDVAVEYGKGNAVFKNGIDPIQYIIANKEQVAEVIGETPSEIMQNIRNVEKVQEYLAKLEKHYDLGNFYKPMQMYISKVDGNVSSLGTIVDWADCILTQDWVDRLAATSLQESISGGTGDQRIDYLADLVHSMMKDHEVDYHKQLEDFDGSMYLDKPRYGKRDDGTIDILQPLDDGKSRVVAALDKLHSFSRLEYGFYEMYKPIGDSKERFVKVKLSTNGELDISGVVALADCEHVEWEYGSLDYLRSLNTGNQRYLFRISLPFNDTNSVLWWKPDNPDPIVADEEEEEGESTQQLGYRYYKPYETERFLRWFGTTYVPILDEDSITKKSVCSAPRLREDVQSNSFYEDATNITQRAQDLTRVSMDTATSTSLLSLTPTATIDVKSIIDEETPDNSGQYIEFIVTGHRQTQALSFHVVGKMYNAIQGMNRLGKTWANLLNSYRKIRTWTIFLEATRTLNPTLDKVWGDLFPGKEYIPSRWGEVAADLEKLQTPNVIDLLRFRQIDIKAIMDDLEKEKDERMDFLNNMSESGEEDKQEGGGQEEPQKAKDQMQKMMDYMANNTMADAETQKDVLEIAEGKNYYNKALADYLFDFLNDHGEEAILKRSENKEQAVAPLDYYDVESGDSGLDSSESEVESSESELESELSTEDQLDLLTNDINYRSIPMTLAQKEKMILEPMKKLYNVGKQDEMAKYDMVWLDEVDELRDSIETFNNLVTRLPVDTYHNKVTSLHIFQDWRNYVEKYKEHLTNMEPGKLFVKSTADGSPLPDKGLGTDGKEHEYTELYVDQLCTTPLVDYSYLYDDDGKLKLDPFTGRPLADRWDYWTDSDFE